MKPGVLASAAAHPVHQGAWQVDGLGVERAALDQPLHLNAGRGGEVWPCVAQRA